MVDTLQPPGASWGILARFSGMNELINLMSKKRQLSYSGLSLKTGSTRQHIRRWLTDAKLVQGGKITGTYKECLACIQEHQRPKGAQGIDPETGLSWAVAIKREQTLKSRVEREHRQEALALDWVSKEHSEKVIRGLCDRLTFAPGRIKSELGLSESQTSDIQRIFSDVHSEFVKDSNGTDGDAI
jgi:hypothetical protein